MNILLITRGIPSAKDSIWGNFELDQAKALKTLGHQVVTISIDQRTRSSWRKIGITHTNIDGIVMYNYLFPLPYKILPRRINNFFVNFFAKKLYKHIIEKEGEVDLIHGHYLPNIRIATVLKDVYNTPVVGTEHWSEIKRKKIRTSVYNDAKETYPKTDCLITVSEPLKQIIKREFNIDSIFVGCVIDSVFEYLPNKKDDVFRFISVGSLFKIKGFDVLIKSFAKAKFNNNVKLHIIGDGTMRRELEQLINSEKLENQVFLEGRKTRPEIMDFMSKSSVYVLSSMSENFATACMEALSAGLPAIMTKCGGPEDFVDQTNAVLVEVDNTDEMANAMRYMYENIANYDSQSISDNIKTKYSAESIAKQLEDIYSEIINSEKN